MWKYIFITNILVEGTEALENYLGELVWDDAVNLEPKESTSQSLSRDINKWLSYL